MSDRALLLERLLSGEIGAGDAAVQRLFERDPSAREEYEALRALELSLERQGDRTRVLLEVAGGSDLPGGEARVRRILDELAGARPPRSGERNARRFLGVYLAAAAVLLAVLWAVGLRQDVHEPEIRMNGGSAAALTALSPVGAVDAYGPFEWSGRLEPGDSFVLRVYDADSPDADAILDSGALYGNRWDPEPELLKSLPERIQWTLTRLDDSNRPSGGLVSQAWLSRR